MSNEREVVDDVSVDERRGRRCALWSADYGWSKVTVEDS